MYITNLKILPKFCLLSYADDTVALNTVKTSCAAQKFMMGAFDQGLGLASAKSFVSGLHMLEK